MTTKHRIPVPTESAEQIALFQWASLAALNRPELGLLVAIPNGGWRTLETGARMKREGVKAGFPDIMLPVPRGKYHGLFIEMKRRRGGHFDEFQKVWAKELIGQGYYHCVTMGWEHAVKVIEAYLRGEE